MIKQIRLISETIGSSKVSGNPYKRFQFEFTDNSKISTFDEAIGKAFKMGDVVDIVTEKRGMYNELVSMTASNAQVPNIQNTASTQPQASQQAQDREKSIIAQTLTKCFSEIMAGHPEIDCIAVQNRLLVAYKFFLENQ